MKIVNLDVADEGRAHLHKLTNEMMRDVRCVHVYMYGAADWRRTQLIQNFTATESIVNVARTKAR